MKKLLTQGKIAFHNINFPFFYEYAMPECEFLNDCLFFNDKLKNMPAAADVMKKMYCLWHFTTCARYKVAISLGRKAVPEDMFPGDKLRAQAMLIQYDIK